MRSLRRSASPYDTFVDTLRPFLARRLTEMGGLVLFTAAVALIAGIGNLTLTVGGVSLEGIAWGSVGIIVAYPIMKKLYDSVGEGHGAKY